MSTTNTNSDTKKPAPGELRNFAKKVWIVVGILALSVCLILILRVAFNIVLMVFAASLIAVFFHGLGDFIQRRTKLKRPAAMAISVIGSFLILIALFWFMGATIQSQVKALSDDFPVLVEKGKTQLEKSDIGRSIIEKINRIDSGMVMSKAQGVFSTSFGVLGDLYIILFLGIFFTVSPSIYKDGIIILSPNSAKKDTRVVLDRISLVLKGWLKGMLLAMLLIAILSVTGLTILGIPMALTLALMAGLLNFIPNFGPLIAMVPAVLLGLTVGPNTAIIIAVMYILIQTLESNVITPMVQKRMIDLPPALTIIAQLLMGSLSGVLGILLATPLLAIVMVLVDELYVKKQGKSETEAVIEKND
ncbi:AI-2E family transporter [Mucilaginibacter pallidiroseus]|uniref:AI-2E family transporter n=1 Tax=Mucilaginibacter pallidiroseus TaxID=2599295 RepID=A0A563UIA2_9SPHI|nr:AI-2E family transporter [Mucilaginibacter pallidiroseus]TWR31130.1 AI-2E family transporter [Mucilaginibacter pallidiroseus]